MAAIADSVLSDLTAGAASGNRMDILGSDPGLTYATVTTNTLGNSTDDMTGPAASTAAASGMEIIFPQISAGTVTATSGAKFWAITNGGAGGASNAVLASGALSATQAVTATNTFSLDAVAVSILDAT